MSFKAGDSVVHPIYGVGRIVRLEDRSLAEDETRLYYVIVADKSTVWVPVDAGQGIGLRQLTPKRDLDGYRHVLKSDPTPLDKDHKKRRSEIIERLKAGSFRMMCEVVRDMTARSRRKPLYDADTALLQKARIDLCREWAASDGVSVEMAFQEVDALLTKYQATPVE
jgi:RNA polymerase-interacting CarD/CdnL/TRCF family regulator